MTNSFQFSRIIEKEMVWLLINPQTNYFEHFRPASCGSTVTPIWGNEKFDTLMINLG